MVDLWLKKFLPAKSGVLLIMHIGCVFTAILFVPQYSPCEASEATGSQVGSPVAER